MPNGKQATRKVVDTTSIGIERKSSNKFNTYVQYHSATELTAETDDTIL